MASANSADYTQSAGLGDRNVQAHPHLGKRGQACECRLGYKGVGLAGHFRQPIAYQQDQVGLCNELEQGRIWSYADIATKLLWSELNNIWRLRVTATGRSKPSANLVKCFTALADQRLPPKIATGRLEAARSADRRSICLGAGHAIASDAGGTAGTSEASVRTSSGSATTTGPGRPERAV